MDCSTPRFPALHYLPEFAHSHVHLVNNAIQPSHPLSPFSPPALNFSKHQVPQPKLETSVKWLPYQPLLREQSSCHSSCWHTGSDLKVMAIKAENNTPAARVHSRLLPGPGHTCSMDSGSHSVLGLPVWSLLSLSRTNVMESFCVWRSDTYVKLARERK